MSRVRPPSPALDEGPMPAGVGPCCWVTGCDTAAVNGRTLYVGGPALLKALRVELPERLSAAAEQAAQSGQSTVYVIEDGKALAVFAIADAIRPESREAVKRLHDA